MYTLLNSILAHTNLLCQPFHFTYILFFYKDALCVPVFGRMLMIDVGPAFPCPWAHWVSSDLLHWNRVPFNVSGCAGPGCGNPFHSTGLVIMW